MGGDAKAEGPQLQADAAAPSQRLADATGVRVSSSLLHSEEFGGVHQGQRLGPLAISASNHTEKLCSEINRPLVEVQKNQLS